MVHQLFGQYFYPVGEIGFITVFASFDWKFEQSNKLMFYDCKIGDTMLSLFEHANKVPIL